MRTFPDRAGPVTIVGVGGMGSRIAEGLVRMGVGTRDSPLTLIDHDTFESHNVTNQLVTPYYVGTKKVVAVGAQLLHINPNLNLICHPIEITGYTPLWGIVFLCLDSMSARRTVMETCIEDKSRVSCVIETRMDSGIGCSHCFDPKNQKHLDAWRLYWHPDNEAENTFGCNGQRPVISAIYGTACLALKQFERYLEKRSSVGIVNRVCTDFDAGYTEAEIWPA